jgi:prepilin-type N-terminal cleavage/methylation domain-containing protein
MRQKAYTLVEILIVVSILAVIFVVGYRAVRTLSISGTQIAKDSTNVQKAQYDYFIGILNDRLAQAWGYTLVNDSYGGATGSLLELNDPNGNNFCNFGVYTNGTVFLYHIKDITQLGNAPLLDVTYGFTNEDTSGNFGFYTTTNHSDAITANVMANWQIPPPFYYTATLDALRPIFVYTSDADLTEQVALQRTNNTGLLEHDLRNYNWSPKQSAFR